MNITMNTHINDSVKTQAQKLIKTNVSNLFKVNKTMNASKKSQIPIQKDTEINNSATSAPKSIV